MLTSLRTRTAGILIKIVFGLIIFSFALFFGYSQIQERGGASSVATVNGETIPVATYQTRLEESLAQIRRSSGGDVSPELETFFRQNLVHQLVGARISIQWAKRIGFVPPSAEIAAAITQTPALQRNGIFDESFYRNVWRGYVSNRYGRDFEAMLEDDLAVETMEFVLPSLVVVAGGEIQAALESEERGYQFDVARLDSEKSKPKFKKHEPLSIGERQKIIEGSVSPEDWERIFSLSPGGKLKPPLKVGDHWVAVKLAKIKDGKTTDPEAKKVERIQDLQTKVASRLNLAFQEPFRTAAKISIAKEFEP